jgi:hypothetical protein
MTKEIQGAEDPLNVSELKPIESPDLVFTGVVTTIQPSPSKHSLQNWVVSTTVETIDSGDFKGKVFSFRIHSPAKAGLAVGKRYRFSAKKTKGGYRVNEFAIEQKK